MICCPLLLSQQTPGRMGGEGTPGPDQDREGRGEEEHRDRGHRWLGWTARKEDYSQPEAQTRRDQPRTEGRSLVYYFCWHDCVLNCWILVKPFFTDICGDGPNNRCPGEGARSCKSLRLAPLPSPIFPVDLFLLQSPTVFVVFLDHQSQVCGQNPDRKLWDWCLVLLAISRGLWKAAKVVDLRVLSKVHEVREDLQISPGQCWTRLTLV